MRPIKGSTYKKSSLEVFRLWTDKSLPGCAGDAILKYKSKKACEYDYLADHFTPTREGHIITIPDFGFDMLQLDPEFNQFLLVGKLVPDSDEKRADFRPAFFGGTDEKPFLVELKSSEFVDPITISSKVYNGWRGLWENKVFYDAIKPMSIYKLEQMYGAKTKRQGDIFAYPHPTQNWDDILANFVDYEAEVSEKSVSLFETRHTLTGRHIRVGGIVIASGKIAAPDHTDLLLDEIHILDQTSWLEHPEEAD